MAKVKKAATGTTKKTALKVAAKPATQVKKATPPAAKTKEPAPAAKAKIAAPKKTAEPKAVEKKEHKAKPEIAKEVKVKVPKTTVKTSVPYQPTYQPLEERAEEAVAASDGPLVRYSDADLSEFKDIINKKLGDAKRELAYLQGLITRKDHLGGEADSRYMTMEDGTVSMEREQLSQMASRQISYIDHLEKALIRIENKTYGICRVTGKLIDKARLKAVPHATLSLEAKMGMKK